MAKSITLYAPDGRTYETSDRGEVVGLKAQGYTEKAPSKTDGSKQDAKKS